MEKRSIVHVEFPTDDREGATRFFSEMFGWTHQDYPEMSYTVFETGNIGGGYPEVDDYDLAQPGKVVVYMASEDIEADLQKAESLGGQTLVPKTEIPQQGWYAIFSDPAGNRIGLFTGQ